MCRIEFKISFRLSTTSKIVVIFEYYITPSFHILILSAKEAKRKDETWWNIYTIFVRIIQCISTARYKQFSFCILFYFGIVNPCNRPTLGEKKSQVQAQTHTYIHKRRISLIIYVPRKLQNLLSLTTS